MTPTARFLPHRFTRAACAAAFAGMLVAAPTAHAGFHYATLTSQRIFDACVDRGINIGLCHDHANFIDPPVDGVTSFHFELAYDTSKYAFDPSKSGPIGAFAVGSDVGPGPGVGTMPLDLLPAADTQVIVNAQERL